MTNMQSVAGSIAWSLVAGLLMLATFEPVKVERQAASVQLSAKAPAAASDAA